MGQTQQINVQYMQQPQGQFANGQQSQTQGIGQLTPQQQQQQTLLELYQQQQLQQQAAGAGGVGAGGAAELQQQKLICINTINQYNQLIHYFQNAGALSAEQQTYLQSLLNNVAIQQQHLQRIQNAEALLNGNIDQAEKEKLAIMQQIEHHKQLQLQLLSVQQVTQNQAVGIQQTLNMHT